MREESIDKNMSLEDLGQRLRALRGELFTLRFNASTAHIKDYSKFKKLRRRIARVLTLLRTRVEAVFLEKLTHGEELKNGAEE